MPSRFFSNLAARLSSSSEETRQTDRDGQILVNSIFRDADVDDVPAFLLDNDNARLLNFGRITTDNATAAVSVEGEDIQIVNFRSGRIEADSGPDASATAISVAGSASIRNSGDIDGDFNGVKFEGAGSSGRLDNLRSGTISSDSRAVDIQGEDITLRNSGEILGTGDQRNGTVYADDAARDYTIENRRGGVIDAGEGNDGAGISLSLAEDGNGEIDVENDGVVAGRGQASAADGTAGDGIRLEGVRGDGFAPGLFEGTISNAGTVTSESTQGTTGAFRAVNNVDFQGTLVNEEGGLFAGAQNGVYFGIGDHSGGSFENRGTVTSDSRALNIDGVGLTVNNAGEILGTGDQRNGTVYADGTADDYSFTNTDTGVVDAGAGNQGSGFGAEIGGAVDGANTFSLDNDGTIQGRGQASAASNLAGDGVRIGNVGNIGTAEVELNNSGTIASESAQGTTAGIRFVNGISFSGELNNSGTISGVQNGLYFGNPVEGAGADHSNVVDN
ncbi:MAG: calcium-binding protein, partial [Pseudomonadota bacterium]